MENPEAFRSALQSIDSPRILVIGDLMLDRYSWGVVERISPEAPIPVLRVLREDQRLGGAGNVMMNLAALGAQVTPCGIVGQDESGRVILDILEQQGMDTSGVVVSGEYRSVLKHRMISGHTHLLRMDMDPPVGQGLPSSLEGQVLECLKGSIAQMDAVVVSDYGKGLLSENLLRTIAALGKTHEIPVIGDPRRGSDYGIYQDFTVIKPNRKETESAVGFGLTDRNSILRAAQVLKYQVGLDYVVISLDKDGLLLFEDPQNFHFFNAESREVFDVVGAGDMVISVLGFMLAGGASIESASYWSQLAASMEIQHVGVVSFSKAELLHRFDFGETSSKIVTLEQLSRFLSLQDQPVVFTNGYFDEICAGHLKFLQQLKVLRGFNVVGINSDRVITEQKGRAPLLNERERAMLLSSVETVDRVVIFDDPDASRLIERIRPQVVVKGERFREQTLPEAVAIEAAGARVEYLQEY